MAEVARRAGSSKETLYAWFGSKQGLFTPAAEEATLAERARVAVDRFLALTAAG